MPTPFGRASQVRRELSYKNECSPSSTSLPHPASAVHSFPPSFLVLHTPSSACQRQLFKMVHFTSALGLMLGAGALVAAAPAPLPTAGPDLRNAVKRATATTCTFSAAAAVLKSKTSCATIVLDNIAVPSGTTLDLTGLNTGTHVIFEGETTFGYEEWSGPLISVSGENIVGDVTCLCEEAYSPMPRLFPEQVEIPSTVVVRGKLAPRDF